MEEYIGIPEFHAVRLFPVDEKLFLGRLKAVGMFMCVLGTRTHASTPSDHRTLFLDRGQFTHATFSQLTQPIPKPICDRSGQPDNTQDVFVGEGETSRFHEINEKGFHKELCSSDRSGQLDFTLSVIKAHNLSGNIRVEQIHDRSGQPDERNSSKAHNQTTKCS